MTQRFMLDTDTVSYALRGSGDVARHLTALAPSEVCISSLTLAELRFGADKRRSRRLHDIIDAFTGPIEVLPFGAEAARAFGTVAASLQSRGVPIGTMDALIAAHALSLSLTLVTNNAKHFDRVHGLVTENWLTSRA